MKYVPRDGEGRPAARRAAAQMVIGRYRALSLHAQLAVLLALLALYGLSSHPALLAAEALVFVALFACSLDAGLLLTVFCIPFAFAYKHVYGVLISPLEVTIVALATAWLLSARFAFSAAILSTYLRGEIWRRFTALDWAVVLFVIAACLSLLAAEDMGVAAWSLRILVIEPVFLYVFIRVRRLSPAVLLALADALVLGAVAVALVGLYQYLFTTYVEAAEGVRRILSVYDSPNHLGLFLGRVAPVALCVAVFGGRRGYPQDRATVVRRVLYAVALVPMLTCLYLTYSRGAWLLGVPAALVVIALVRGRRTRIAALALLALALLALIPIARTPRVASLFTVSDGTSFLRVVLWLGALNMIRAHPLWGVGIGNFMGQYPRYMLPIAWREPVLYHPHNIVLEFWTILGIPGVIALVALVAAFFRAGLARYRRLTDHPMLAALTLGLLASMADCLAHGLVDAGYALMDLAFVFMLTLAMVSET
jgi:O-antigen ligase